MRRVFTVAFERRVVSGGSFPCSVSPNGISLVANTPDNYTCAVREGYKFIPTLTAVEILSVLPDTMPTFVPGSEYFSMFLSIRARVQYGQHDWEVIYSSKGVQPIRTADRNFVDAVFKMFLLLLKHERYAGYVGDFEDRSRDIGRLFDMLDDLEKVRKS